MEDAPQSVAAKIDKQSPTKIILLQMRLKQQGRPTNQDPIPRRNSEQPARLSFTQELLWLQYQSTPGPGYNVPRALRIQGELDVSALKAALYDLVLRQTVLRTRLVEADGTPYQIVDDAIPPDVEFIDLQMAPAAEREQEVIRLINTRAGHQFDLATEHLLKLTLLQLSPREHVLILVTHCLASDGWSRDVLFRELSELYDAHHTGRPACLPDLPIQYEDYAAWQRDTLQADVFRKQLDYWKQHLEGAPALLELPLDSPRPPVQTYHGNTIRRHLLTVSELADLKALGLEEKATLFMTTLALTKVLLYRHTGQGDLVVGTPIGGRDRAETENLVGYFMNTLALRTNIAGDLSFRDVLRRIRSVTLGAFEHQTFPYIELVKELNPKRSASYNPVFQVLFGFGQGTSAPFTLSDLTVIPIAIDHGMAKFDLTVAASAVETGLLGALEYNVNLFAEATIERMMDHWENLIKGVLANPDAPIAELPLLGASEREQLLVTWNRTQTDYPEAANLPGLFEAQVQRTPEAVAVEFAGHKLTYAELNAQANQVAHQLRRCGVGPEIPVGILMERSLDLIVGLLGILKSGGAYVPLDDNYPNERILQILQLAKTPIVVTQSSLHANLTGFRGCIISLDQDEKQLAAQSEQNPVHQTKPENLAYVMFTSGSTGQPKGIAVPHSALVHYVRAATDIYGLKSTDRVLQFASICFDTSIEEIFPCLCVGATLVVRTTEMLDTVAQFWQCTSEWGITLLSLPTAFWHELARAAEHRSGPLPARLRMVVIGGEKARADQLDLWRQQFGQSVQLLNTYGPTETTVVATACDITAPFTGEIPIGRPIPNVQVYLLDAYGQLVPAGVTGEMYIGGAGVARGYLHDADRTEARFVDDPFSGAPGARLYRTGDLARWLPDGNLEFMGRGDQQVKIRGFRIELGEIETVLESHPQVGAAAIVVREDSPGDVRLFAYVTPHRATRTNERDLRQFLSTRLPHYMIPYGFVFIDVLPRTPGGKIDRRKLPDPPGDTVGPRLVVDEPRDDSEIRLKAHWERVLGKTPISVCDNFFDLGGHSLLAIRLLSEVKGDFGTGISLAEMLRAPTVRDMAQLLHRKQQGESAWSALVPLQPHGERPPLFCAPVGGGSAFYYRALAAHIGPDQPLYTFEPLGMSEAHEPHQTVEEMAAYYIEQMRTVQHRGPYSLCGLSFGAIVAYEMACQLMAAGEQVANVILFDGWAPGPIKIRNRPRRHRIEAVGRNLHYKVAFHLENLSVCQGVGDRLEYVHARMERLRKRIHDWRRGTPWQLSKDNPLRFELPEVFMRVKAAEVRARTAYRPKNYTGRILLLRAHLQSPKFDFDPTLGWDGLATDIEVVETPGTHFSLLEEPCVRVTVTHVHRALDKAHGSV
jgi:amino acid adenylation domain-containing protein